MENHSSGRLTQVAGAVGERGGGGERGCLPPFRNPFRNSDGLAPQLGCQGTKGAGSTLRVLYTESGEKKGAPGSRTSMKRR